MITITIDKQQAAKNVEVAKTIGKICFMGTVAIAGYSVGVAKRVYQEARKEINKQ